MKSLQDWFDEYAVSHQHPINKKIHYVCVPAIFFSIVGLLMSIPNASLISITGISNALYVNWAVIALIVIMFFYLRLSLSMSLKFFVFSVGCILINHWIGTQVSLGLFSLTVFIIAWAGQFYGHKLEGAKPSFLQDLQFLLIGPAWVIAQLFNVKK